ncbi:MAG TPA: M1 family aminopeptidase [Casimicrobiaceae bacterium]|nr:M1 family aminopeptidase [Casimicrobiaceae bacterium]
MGAFLAIAAFEARTRLRRLSTWVYFAIFVALSMMWVAAAGGAIEGAIVSFGSGKVWINSPFAIAQTVAFLGMAALTVIGAVMGRAIQQDAEYRTEAFFHTAPIGRLAYLGGRFAGAAVVLLVILSSIAIGSFAGLAIPGIDPDRVGPVRIAAYVLPYLTILLPNLVVLGAIFFCMGALARRMLPVYVGSVVLLVGYLAGNGLMRNMENKTAAALLDPFGSIAMSRVTEYWSITEKNEWLVPFEGLLAANRAVWLAVAVAFIGLVAWRYRFAQASEGGKRRQTADDAGDAAAPVSPATFSAPGRVRPWRLLPRMAWMDFRETVKNVYFGVIALAGVLFFVTTSTTAGSIFGTTTWPVTWQMLELVSGTFGVFMVAIIAFYAGELVWRERDSRLDQIHDALPVPTWLPFAAKLVALMLVPVVLQAVLMLAGIAVQTGKGYTHYEPALYVRTLFGVDLVDYWLVCVLALAVHSVVDQKYVGHFVMIVYFIALATMDLVGLEHLLYKPGATGGYVLSDMNGFGPYPPRFRSLQAYWAAGMALVAIAGYLAWVRGTTSDLRGRLAIARRRFTRPVAGLATAAALAMAGTGAWVFWNTNVANPYRTAHDQLRRLADYEKKYKATAADPQPKITEVALAVDLYPSEQRVRMRGSYALENRSGKPVGVVHLGFFAGESLKVHELALGVPATLVVDDMPIGVRSYRLAAPLAPGATTDLRFDLEVVQRGFRNSGAYTDVVANGSFVNGISLLPVIGYQERGELVTDRDRKKFGLAPKERMRPRDDPIGLAQNGITTDADFVTFEATVGTEEGQLAIAPGYLVRDWSDGGRHYFAYRMDAPILNFYAFQSGRYAVRRDRWNDVAIEVWHHPGHEFNLDRMVAATKDGLDYFTRAFGPYQHRQFRIVEFPRYQAFAQSFPNTIPYSEGIGFIARVRDDEPDDIDYPYYVTAHELAHQWWAHQVIGANVQGETMLVESLAQYSALMVMKRKVGDARMRRFLRYELDRYLLGRSTEQKKELPLARVENQDYIHYRKGSLVMYALQDYLGEEALNRAIRAFRDEWAFRGPPYPTTLDLLKHVRAATPAHLQKTVDDLFESITLYENRAASATAKALPDGRYEVSVEVLAKKLRADGLGRETEVPLDDWIDVGVLDADGNALAVEKLHIDAPSTRLGFVVDRKPAQAGIDPFNKLIDRRPKDNTLPVAIGP